ncbi:MAG: hypothetical protein M1835_001888 [Candelina submexicana]|nr:MAG: hypothetical protein M1835_001888 [Candelina submexicana]
MARPGRLQCDTSLRQFGRSITTAVSNKHIAQLFVVEVFLETGSAMKSQVPMALPCPLTERPCIGYPLLPRYLYSVPTARLHNPTFSSELRAQGSVTSRVQKGCFDGLETDTNGLIYTGNLEKINAINVFNPTNRTVNAFVRDPCIGWTDTMSVGMDGYLYFIENQYCRGRRSGMAQIRHRSRMCSSGPSCLLAVRKYRSGNFGATELYAKRRLSSWLNGLSDHDSQAVMP